MVTRGITSNIHVIMDAVRMANKPTDLRGIKFPARNTTLLLAVNLLNGLPYASVVRSPSY